MKINLCEPCLAENKLKLATAKGQTSMSGFRLSLCRSPSCKAVWKKINSSNTLLTELIDKAEKNLKVLL